MAGFPDGDIKVYPYVNFVCVEDGMYMQGINVPAHMNQALHDEDYDTWQAYLKLLDECVSKNTESDMPDMFPFS